MEELYSLVRRVDPGVFSLLVVVGVMLERRLRGLETRTAVIETKLDLVLEGHKVVERGSEPSPSL